MNIVTLILAAGESSRLGTSKQLLDIHGEPLLVRTIKTALASNSSSTIVVLGALHEQHETRIKDFPVTIVPNANWKNGMGSSLKAGINVIQQQNFDAVIVMVCDQPLLTSDHLNQLIERHISTKAKVVASHYAGTDGVPALFEKSLFSDILNLSDSEGAKKIIRKNAADLQTIAFPQGEIDLDLPNDYIHFKKNYEGK